MTCLIGTAFAPLFEHYSVTHIDWRWEMLSKVLDKMVPLLFIMSEHFVLDKILHSDSGTPLDSQVSKAAATVLQIRGFPTQCEMVRVHGKSVEHFGHRLEGCPCHQPIMGQSAGLKRKKADMKAATGDEGCFMKGRMAPWMAAVGLETLLSAIRNDTSPRLQTMLDTAASPAARAEVLREQAVLKTSLCAWYEDKLGYWKRGVYRALGGLWGDQGGLVDTSRECIREAMAEHDDAIRSGAGERLGRVFRKFFAHGSVERLQFTDFGAGEGSRLRDFPRAFVMLQMYALGIITERRVEQLHALIKALSRTMRNVGPPYVCAKLRESFNMQMLRNDRAFWDLCVAMWRKRSLVALVLRLRVGAEELKGMSNAQQIKRVYQCALEDEYADITEEKRASAQWTASTVNLRAGQQPLEPEAWKRCVSYVKKVWLVGAHYSLPREIFVMASRVADTATRLEAYADAGTSPVSQALVAVGDPPAQHGVDNVADLVFFVVKHRTPEKRTSVSEFHLDQSRTCVHVCTCQVMGRGEVDGNRSVLLSVDHGKFVVLDATVLAMHMRYVLSECTGWDVVSVRPQYRLFPADADQAIPLMDAVGGHLRMGQLATSEPASSTAIVPVGDRTESAAAKLTRFLRQCVAQDALVGSLAVVRVGEGGLTEDAAKLLVGQRILVPRSDDATGLQLDREAVQWTAWVEVSCPRNVMRAARTTPLLSCSKLDLVLRLRLEGMEPAAGRLEDWQPDGPQDYTHSWHRPLSYFAALLRRYDIVAKGAPAIAHGYCDGYYRALLSLPSIALQLMLSEADNDEMDNDWYLRKLRDVRPVEGGGSDVEPSPEPDLLMIMDVPAEPFRGPPGRERWVRQSCDVGAGTPVVKVFFDHASPTDDQRGWCPSAATKCCKWQQCSFHATVRDYCAFMYAWHEPERKHKCKDKASHLEYDPEDERVERIKAKLRMHPF